MTTKQRRLAYATGAPERRKANIVKCAGTPKLGGPHVIERKHQQSSDARSEASYEKHA